MRFWIVIPSASFARSKSRLAPILAPAERQAFSRDCLRHVLRAARRAAGARRTLVVSRSAEALGLARRSGGIALIERRANLNGSLHQAAEFARRRGARGVLVVHSDLPGLNARELARVMAPLRRRRGVALAPDRENSGTNALAIRIGERFSFRFGPRSFAMHLSEARRRRLHAWIVAAAGLAEDIDTPQDYRRLAKVRPGTD
jgi:2-phospho-L-lactate/phosphoenolpyruvate guanylyltransferase